MQITVIYYMKVGAQVLACGQIVLFDATEIWS